jgi:putative phage-type endonuclease
MSAVALAEPLTQEWFAQRRLGVSASEIAAVLGISPWESPFSLHWKKREGWETEASPEMSAGTRLEPVIADWWADECDPNRNLTVMPSPLLAHPGRPWQLATPDRLVHQRCASCDLGPPEAFGCWDCRNTSCDGPPLAVLECKYVAQSWDSWGEPGTDDIPVHYRAQVQWQCDVVDVEDWYLAALGPGGFREYHGRRDERDLRVMREYARRFLADLEADNAPSIDDHAATLATVKRLHPDLDDTEAEVPADIAAGYRRACAMERKAKAVKKRYEARLRDAMGRSRKATTNGAFVASRSIYDVDEHLVKEHTVDRLNPPRAKKEAS